MLNIYKYASPIEKALAHLFAFLGFIHLSIIMTCFEFGFIKQFCIGLVSLVVWLNGIYYILSIRKKYAQNKESPIGIIPKQLFLIMGIASLFVISAFISPYTNIVFGARACFFWSVFISVTIISGIGWTYSRYLKNPSFVSSSLLHLGEDWFLWGVLLLAVILRVGMLDTLQRWDAGEYYYALGNACANFDFDWSSFFDNFRLCNHTTLGFSFIMSIGEFLNPRGTVGVLCVSLLLTLYALYKLYYLLTKILSGNSRPAAGFITLICSVTPFFLGSFGYLTPDYLMTIAFILAICAEYNKEYFSQYFWLVIAINTKEPAIFTVFGYFLFKLFGILFEQKIKKELRIRSIIKNTSLWVGLCSGILFLVILKLQGGFLWKGLTNTNPIQFSNTEVNSFGFNLPYILFRLKQHFILNFAWVFSLLLLLSICFTLVKQKKQTYKSTIQPYTCTFLFSLTGALLFALIANCIFITAGAYRYATVFFTLYGILVLTVYWELVGSFVKVRINNSISIILTLLLSVEAFIHIDFVSAKVFETQTTGNWFTVMTNFTHGTYGNDLCNNRQYTWLDTAFDKLLNKINYDGSQDILIMGGQEQGLQLDGNGIRYRVCWDSLKQKRIIYDDSMMIQNPNLIPINTITEGGLENVWEAGTLRENAVAFFIPYYQVDEDECLNILSEYYQIKELETITCFGGELRYYTLTLKTY